MLFERYKKKVVLHRIVTGDEKWNLTSEIIDKAECYSRQDSALYLFRWEERVLL